MMSQPNKTKFGYYDVKLNTSVLLVLMFCNQSNSKLRFLVTFISIGLGYLLLIWISLVQFDLLNIILTYFFDFLMFDPFILVLEKQVCFDLAEFNLVATNGFTQFQSKGFD